MIIKSSTTHNKLTKVDGCTQAQQHIRAAIQCLGQEAKDSVVAKESIANLSVVLLDLQ